MDLLLNIIRVRRRGYEDITAHCVQNIDLDDDCSITCTGYERNWKYKFFLYCVCALLIGIPYLFLRWYPQFEVHYFWKRCTLENAQILLIRDSSGRYSLHRIIELIESENDVSFVPLRFFIYKLQRFMWYRERVQFQKIRGLANGVNTLADIFTLTGGLPLDEKQQKLKIHGKNRIDVDVKSYWRLLVDEALNPFYIFEAFSVTLWIFDEYHYYAAFIIVLSVISIYTSLSQTKKQHVILKQQVASCGSKEIVVVHTSDTGRCEELWERLVPGDVIEIPPNGCVMMCDALLISGICIVNESSLTGESAPVTKIPPSNGIDEIYKPNSLHMRHTLYCGTQVLQTRYYENNKVIAVVVGTGCNTAKGQLVRSILYPKPVAFDFMVESIKFIFILFGVASLAMIYSTYLYILRGASLETLLLRTLDIITIVVPPTLPAAMTAGTVYSQKRLRKQGIFCTSPPRILVSGKTTLVCFDKTGTLTEEGMDLWGVLPSPVYGSRYQHLSSSSSQPPPLTDDGIVNDVKDLDEKSVVKSALAVCHSLTVIDGKICGDPLDLVMFKATEWELEEPGEDNAKFDLLNPTVVRPKRKVKWKEATTSEASVEDTDDSFLDYEVPYEIGLIRLFPFTSSAQNMSIICRTLGARNMTVFSKGAPEKILHLCNVNTVPADINKTLSRFTIAGYRVIALAYKEMPKTFTWLQAQRVTRDQIENELNFLGLLLIQNNIKPQSEPVIKQLQMAKIKCIMATGDNIMTAVSVSRDCGILSPKYHVVLLSVNTSSSVPEIELQSLSGRENEKINIKDPLVQIVMDGNAWYLIRCHFPELIDVVTVKAVVFARMSPQQKTTLIETLQGLDYFVTMCGDGANDCGALKAAHVGISLSRTEASIVAPFTCQEGNVSCVVELIKEGRCALVTSFGLFNYMAMYSLIQFISVILLYSIGAEMGTIEFLYVDLVLTTTLVMTMGTTSPSDTLITRQPITSLVSLRNVAPLLLQILVALLFQLIALNLVQWQPWYVPVTPAKEDEEVVTCWENTAVYSISCFQYLILAFVYSRGKHHRQSFYKNWLMLVLFTLLTIFTAVLALYPIDYLSTLFEMEVWTTNEAYFRIWLLVLPAIHFIVSYLIELIFNEKIGSILFRNLTRRKIPKKKYRVIEEQSESGVITYSV